ncbi:MAG: response regulator [Sedimenticola sp.]|nr:response regulator [Sedimenticola sp.]
MDINMPGMSGYEAAQVIRQMKGNDYRHIIAMTSEVNTPSLDGVYAQVIDDCILKPFQESQLVSMVEMWAGRLTVIHE